MPRYMITTIQAPLGHSAKGFEPEPPDDPGTPWMPVALGGSPSVLFVLWKEVTLVAMNGHAITPPGWEVRSASSDVQCKHCGQRYGNHCGQICPGQNPQDPNARTFEAS